MADDVGRPRRPFTRAVNVPADAPYGMYDGAIEVSTPTARRRSSRSPLSVAATAQQDADGTLQGTTVVRRRRRRGGAANLLYNNGSVFGAHDWTWRAESGDWRFFFLDVPKAPPPGTLFLANTTWDDAAPHTDLDTRHPRPVGEHVPAARRLGVRSARRTSSTSVGASEDTNIGAGVWQFDTATGGNEEIVAAPAQQGLHAFLEHQVLWQGGKFDVPFELTVGSVAVDPSAVDADGRGRRGHVRRHVHLERRPAGRHRRRRLRPEPVPGRADERACRTTRTTRTRRPTRCRSPSPTRRARPISVTTSGDNDLYILRDANGDGTFSFPTELVASSATGSGAEAVSMTLPDDGNYQAWVHGFGITGTEATQVHLDIVQGTDVTVTAPAGPVTAGTPVTVHGTWAKALTPGQVYHGEVLMGPASAPTAISVPITITRQ